MRPRRGRRRFARAREAVSDLARADITDWLATEALTPGGAALTSDITGSIGSYIADKVLPETESTADDKRELSEAMTDHFWCDLLAQFACSMNRLNEEFDKAPDLIVSAIHAARQQDERSAIADITVQVAVKSLVKGIRELPGVRHFDDVVKATKMLASFICPEPEKHRAVVECCISSLGRDIITDEVTGYLRQVLPKEWMKG